MVLDELMDLILIFGVFCLNWWIMRSPNYDVEELVELVMWINKLMKVIGVFMLSEMFDIQ